MDDGIKRTVQAFEEGVNNGKIVGSECRECGALFVPPRPVCRKCGSYELEFKEVEGKGKLITWTIIHISPPSYMDMAPYTLGIVELVSGQRLTGIVLVPEEGLKVGMDLEIAFAEEFTNIPRLRWVRP